MRRISKDCNPIIKNGKNLFQDEDSTLDPPVEGTFLNAEWLNSVQEEICNVIEKEFPLEPKKNNQLLEALNTKIKNGINNVLKKEREKTQEEIRLLKNAVKKQEQIVTMLSREVTSNDEVLWKSLTGVRDELRKSLTEAREVLRKKIDAQHLDLSGVELKVIKTNHGDNMQWFWAFNGQPAYGVKQSEWER